MNRQTDKLKDRKGTYRRGHEGEEKSTGKEYLLSRNAPKNRQMRLFPLIRTNAILCNLIKSNEI